jgi:hypothetical protein
MAATSSEGVEGGSGTGGRNAAAAATLLQFKLAAVKAEFYYHFVVLKCM